MVVINVTRKLVNNYCFINMIFVYSDIPLVLYDLLYDY